MLYFGSKEFFEENGNEINYENKINSCEQIYVATTGFLTT